MRPAGCDDLQAALACVDALRESVPSLRGPELIEAVCGIEVLTRKTHATMLELLAGLNAAKVGRGEQGFGTTSRLLSAMLDLSTGQARARVRDAEQLATRVTVTVDYDTLIKQLSGATLDYSQHLSATQTRLAACDAKIIPVVMGGDGEPLDVGRAMRTAPWESAEHSSPETANALSPVVTEPPALCQAHHVLEWNHGGRTEVNNMCLICPTHHRWIHATGWDITLRGNLVEFRPPAILDPDRRPLTNPLRR